MNRSDQYRIHLIIRGVRTLWFMADEEAGQSPRSQTDVVIEGVKGMLTRGELEPGSRLPIEKDLAA